METQRPSGPPDLEALEAFLTSPERSPGTLSLGELHGFLFTITSAPELVPFPEVFDFIFDGDETVFESSEEAERVLGAIMALYNDINEGVLAGAPKLPSGIVFADDPMDNFEPGPLSDWARGFAAGHGWLEESWDLELPDEVEEELAATIMVLSLFASREMAERFAEEGEPDEPSVESLASTSARLFEDAVASYAGIGRSIYQARREVEAAVPVRADPRPGRNDPCPCGSGRKFKKCCGAQVH